MKKQSAVQWLVEQVNSDCLNSAFIRPELVKQAKEMEKEQIEDAHEIGYINGGNHKSVNGEQYYNETFNK